MLDQASTQESNRRLDSFPTASGGAGVSAERRKSRKASSTAIASDSPLNRVGGWIAYGRLSVEEDSNGTSLDNQKTIINAWIVAQGHQLYRTILDNGCSGGTLDRPGMRQLIAEVESGMVEGVVIAKLDRISRSLKDTMWLIDLFTKHKVGFACVRDPINTTTAAGKIFFQIQAAFAEFERATISERQKSSQVLRRSRGQFTGGIVPMGFRSVGPEGGRRLEVDPVIGPKIALCWSKIRDGASLRDLMSYLAAVHVRTRRGGVWTITSVCGMLHRRCYREAIVDATIFDDANRILAARWSPTKAKQVKEPTLGHCHQNLTTDRIWPLQGLVRCAHCGSAIVGNHGNGKGGRYYYLTCNGRQRRGSGICTARDLPAEAWEKAAIKAIAWVGERPELLLENLARYARERASGLEPARQRRRELIPERDRLQTERDRLVEAVQTGDVVARAIAPALERVQEQLDTVLFSLNDAEQQISEGALDEVGMAELVADLRAAMLNLPKAEPLVQKGLLRDLVSRIDLGRDRDITLHLKFGSRNGGSPEKNFPPNHRGSEGSTSWCPGKDSNLHIFKGY